jgi:hypothetical protein
MVTGNTEPVRLTQTRFREFPFLFKPAQYEVPLATRCRIALDLATDVTAFLLKLGFAVAPRRPNFLSQRLRSASSGRVGRRITASWSKA